MKVAIVGSTGILGRAVIPLLLQHGHEVRAFARSAQRAEKLLPQNIELEECDFLSPDLNETIESRLRGCEAVVHIATAIPQDFTAPNAWEPNTRLRTEAVRMLLDACIAIGTKQYIQQSIIMAYPDCGENWITEDTSLDNSPTRAWLCSPVIQMEAMIRNIPPRNLQWCILRGGSFVGLGTSQDMTLERLRTGKEVIPCDGRNFVSLIHVTDMATAIVAALQYAPAGSIFNIVDDPMRQFEYSDLLAISIGADKPPRDYKDNCPPSWRCDNQRAKSTLNWSPKHDIIPR